MTKCHSHNPSSFDKAKHSHNPSSFDKAKHLKKGTKRIKRENHGKIRQSGYKIKVQGSLFKKLETMNKRLNVR